MPACGMGKGMGKSVHTCACAIALAGKTRPPCPVPRLGPINRMGRAARYRAHGHTGQASAKRNAKDENSSNIARRGSSHELRKRTRDAQLAESFTRICAAVTMACDNRRACSPFRFAPPRSNVPDSLARSSKTGGCEHDRQTFHLPMDESAEYESSPVTLKGSQMV